MEQEHEENMMSPGMSTQSPLLFYAMPMYQGRQASVDMSSFGQPAAFYASPYPTTPLQSEFYGDFGRFFAPPHELPSRKSAVAERNTNLYIRGLSQTTTDNDLYNLCTSYGNIISAKAIIDYATRQCKGYGFVLFETEAECDTAIPDLAAKGYEVSYARDTFDLSKEEHSNTNIYITNLPTDITEDAFVQLFEPYAIVSHNLLRDRQGNIRGTGFVRYLSALAHSKIGQPRLGS